MDLLVRHRQASEGFTCLTSGRFILDPDSETIECILAASSCALHLFAIEKLGAEELIVPVTSLDVFGHVAQVECLRGFGGDRALVLFKTGELKIFACKNGSLLVLRSIPALQDLVDDYAMFLTVRGQGGNVAVGSRFGKITLLKFGYDGGWSDCGNVSCISLDCQRRTIDLKQEKDSSGKSIMSEGIERLVSLAISGVPDGWYKKEDFLERIAHNLLWVGVESPKDTAADTTRACTRVALISSPLNDTISIDTNADSDLLSFKTHWCKGNLPPGSIPAPFIEANTPGPAFFSIIQYDLFEGNISDQPSSGQCFSTASRFEQQIDDNGGEFLVSFDDLRRLYIDRNEGPAASCWFWEPPSADDPQNVLVLGTAGGRLYRITLEEMRQNNEEYYEQRGQKCLKPSSRQTVLYDQQGSHEEEEVQGGGLIGWDVDIHQDSFSLHANGGVEGGIVAMAPLTQSRLVCVTDDHAMVLLRLHESTPPTPLEPPSFYAASDVGGVDIMPTCSYEFVHCYQGAGSLVSCAKFHNDGVVTAVRGGSFERLLKGYSERAKSFKYLQHIDSLEDMDFDEENDEEEVKEMQNVEEIEEAAAAGATDVDEVINNTIREGQDFSAAAGEDVDNDILVGGATAYGAPGALITIHPDTLLEKMFEGEAGEVLGVTGLWPLKRNPNDIHHVAVLLASTANARVLAVDGGCVFSDVTDSLQMKTNLETLAAGNLDMDDWVAHVSPSCVRAFRLDSTTPTASVIWHPPASTTITNGVVSSGFVVIQLLFHSQHSLVALKLSTSGTMLEFKELGKPFVLAYEASCIGNMVSSTHGNVVLAVGTYRPSVMILELCLLEEENYNWRLLGETDLSGVALSDVLSESPKVPRKPLPPSSSPKTTPEKKRPADFDIPQCVEWNDWQPGSPLAAAAKDFETRPHAMGKTTATTVPASIVVSSHFSEGKAGGLEVWVSSRSGDVHRLQFGPPTEVLPEEGAGGVQVTCVFSVSVNHGELPPTLALMPKLRRVSPIFEIMAVSNRASMLRTSLNQGAIDELRLHTPGVSCAIPLVLEVPSGGDRLFLFAASADGALSLSSMEAHQRSKVIARPLPWRPDVIAAHEEVPGVVAIAGRKWYRFKHSSGATARMPLPHVALFDAASGESLNDFGDKVTLVEDETITGLSLIPHNFWEQVRKHLKTFPADREWASNVGEEQKYRCFILASSTIEIKAYKLKPGDARGRLLFFACPLHAEEPLVLLKTLYFPDPVYTVEFSDYVETLSLLHKAIAIVATGRRLVSYYLNLDPSVHDYLVKDVSKSINSPARTLRLSSVTNFYGMDGKNICAACDEGEVTLMLYYKPRHEGSLSVFSLIEVETYSPEIFRCIDSTMWSMSDQISLDSSGIINLNITKYRHDGSQGHVGDAHPLGFAQPSEWSGALDVPIFVVTSGGGVVEIKHRGSSTVRREDYKDLIDKDLLLALQLAIVESPEFKLNTSVKKFLKLDMKRDIYKHSRPLVGDIGGEIASERPLATTAEGPSPAAIFAEPALEEFMSAVNNGNSEEETLAVHRRPKEMLDLRVMRLFLDCEERQQHELLEIAIKKVSGEVQDIDVGAFVYELAHMGAHNMF